MKEVFGELCLWRENKNMRVLWIDRPKRLEEPDGAVSLIDAMIRHAMSQGQLPY